MHGIGVPELTYIFVMNEKVIIFSSYFILK